MTSLRTPPQTPVPERTPYVEYRNCDWHNDRRDVVDAIDCVYSERNHVAVILCKFVLLIKAWGRNVNIEYNKRILNTNCEAK